jgi:hypothetical protein
MRTLKSVVSACAIALMLVVSIDYVAFAATGRSMILGKSNSADKVTTLTRTTPGPAMQFKVKNGKGAPIKVNSKGRVGKLNADMVDSKHASDLGVRTLAYSANISVSATSSFVITIPSVPAGDYLATMDGWIYGPSGGYLYCRLNGVNGASRLDVAVDAVVGDNYPFAGSADVNVPTTKDLSISCTSNVSGSWSDYNDFHLSLTTIDQLTSNTVSPRPVTKPKAGAAR